jgi:hypothetical protein
MTDLDNISDRFSGRVPGDSSSFWFRAGRGYRDGFERMRMVPPEDAFWYDTDGLVSEDKLERYLDLLLARDPHDVRALWSAIGFDVRCCSNTLTEDVWKRLLDLGEFQPRWLVEYELWVCVASGKDTVPLLVELLQRNELVESVRGAVLELRHSEDPSDTAWATRVLDTVDGKST